MRESAATSMAQQPGAVAGTPELERIDGKSRTASWAAYGAMAAAVGLLALGAWLLVQNVVNIHPKDGGKAAPEARTDLTSEREIVRRVPHEIPVPEVAPALKAEVKRAPAPEPKPAREEPLPGQSPFPVSVKREKTLTERQLASGMMADVRSSPQVRNLLESYAGGRAEGGARYASGGPLGESLKPIRVEKGGALRMKNRHLTLAQGTFINCIMETAVDTSVPGMTSCRIPENVFSMDGRTLLIERGSRVFGEYRGAVANGLARLFLLWTRVETPHGVIIDLVAALRLGADVLARAGRVRLCDDQGEQVLGNELLRQLPEHDDRAHPRGDALGGEHSADAPRRPGRRRRDLRRPSG